MRTEKIKFNNKQGMELAARLELPDSEPSSYAIFAHCFTCNKNLTAVSTIGKRLTEKGIAVLRFDFTGLGESEGDFENTNFSSNMDDIYSAVEFLSINFKSPSLLIGHSLGGAAVLFASKNIASIQAVATIGAPSNPKHVSHLFQSNLEEINQNGKAIIQIGGREFSIKKQFLDDIQGKNIREALSLKKQSILILHSPQDTTVGIDNALDIYKSANHPKSFISLDGADHLLSNKADSSYVGNVIATWAERYLSYK